jgi:CBS domain-containing protein
MKSLEQLTALHFQQVTHQVPDSIGMLVQAPPRTVGEHAPLSNVARVLVEQDIPAVAVVDASASLCGVITSSDVLAAGEDWTAADAMSSTIAVRASTAIATVADLMAREHAEYVVVTDAVGQVVGLVTARDVARYRAGLP